MELIKKFGETIIAELVGFVGFVELLKFVEFLGFVGFVKSDLHRLLIFLYSLQFFLWIQACEQSHYKCVFLIDCSALLFAFVFHQTSL